MGTSLIIAAAGKNSRLSRFYFPKVLLPLHNRAIITHIIDFWKADEVIVVTSEHNIDVIRGYMGDKLTYVLESRAGSAYAVESGIKAATHSRVIVNWCDVVPTQPVALCGNLIFTSPDIPCRYNGLTGGFYGVFSWDKDAVSLTCGESEKELDLLDVLDLSQFSEAVVPAIDIGDLSKYSERMRIVDNPVRSFNRIVVGEATVTKICVDESLRIAEENWYREVSPVLDFVPKPISYNPLVLQRINGAQRFDRVDALYPLAAKIHASKPPVAADPAQCWDMYIHKTIRRLEAIDFMFPFRDRFAVNGIECADPVGMLKGLDIADMIPQLFTPIHGDLTTSNVLWEGDRPFVIDPRGIFGKTLLYGDPDYDIAKIYYSSTNWHLLNKGVLVSEVLGENKFGVADIPLFGNRKIDFLLAIIWLSVAEYVKSNVLSSMYAYLTGSYLLARWCNLEAKQ